jgi:transcriptional regulator with XRE-family HTH domain
MSLGEKVKALREKKGMNQKQVAEASSITQATISRIESGGVKELKSEALKRLAEALGVTVDYLVGKTEKLTPSDIIGSDTTVQYILSGYVKLSRERRDQLRNFVRFLNEQEERPRRHRRHRLAAVRRSRRPRRRRQSTRLDRSLGRHRYSRRKEVKEVRKVA